MFKIYGSKMCPDCINVKYNFDKYGIEYEFIDINESLRNLKVFLDYRDKLPVFDHCKEIGDIGLPALVKEDGEVFLSWEKYLEEKGLEVVYPGENSAGEACSIDRKGC
ncbi:MAG: glutaredoxin [Clostridia bacterium]|nr:glutaredoxin [Clostridia bacterium]MBR3295081.1 glutaredoxin [Clostridia bacterium]